METIFAMSSGAPPAAIAIVRLSGSRARTAAAALAGSLPADRVAALRALRDPRDGRLLDRALVLVFCAPRSATGEDVVELHVHGGRAVGAAVEDALAALPGLRRAQAGEFTRRALANAIIDLTEAEGLGDLLAAETESQRRAALQIAEGGLRVTVMRWTTALVEIAAQVEAQLDFSDEDEVPSDATQPVLSEIAEIADAITLLLAEPPVERLKDGIRVVLAGPPNSGKSTLLNALAGRDAAIVSPLAGTTRDRIEVPLVRGGIGYVLIDTAGLRDASADPVEQIGIARARAAVQVADLVVWLGDSPPEGEALWIWARADLPERSHIHKGVDLAVSAANGAGLAELWSLIAARSAGFLPRESALATNARQRGLLAECLANLRSASESRDPLLVAENLRLALGVLDAIVGKAGIDDVLDALFARFCIGK